MDCNCNSDSAKSAAPAASGALKQSFRRFWPDQFAFPPGAPWLAAAVNRAEAYDLVQRYAARFPGIEQGSFAAFAELVSSVLYSDAAEYAAERKKKKGGGGTTPTTPTNCSESGTCNGVSQTITCAVCLGSYCDGSVLKCIGAGMGGGGTEPRETETMEF